MIDILRVIRAFVIASAVTFAFGPFAWSMVPLVILVCVVLSCAIDWLIARMIGFIRANRH